MPLRSNPKSVILWSLLLAQLSGGALQQQHSYNAYQAKPPGSGGLVNDGPPPAAAASAADSLHTPMNGQSRFRDTYVETSSPSIRASSQNERALATFAPAEDSLPAVRAPPALSSRQPARSLRDWEVEDIMLLATVDGKIHARDRKTGAGRWKLETDRPMVETIYHPYNKSAEEEAARGQTDPLWIVEPSEDGKIYVYLPGSGLGMQKLDYTVKELVDATPYDSQTQPAVTYTAEKKTTLITVDAGTGNVLKSVSAGGLFANDDTSCRKVNPLEGSLEEEDCKRIGTITLGLTEYLVGIADGNRHVATIRYTEWGPNKRDSDLQKVYGETMDKKYVYTKHDGTIFGVDFASGVGYGSGSDYESTSRRPIYKRDLLSPVVRVFDIFRPSGDSSGDTSLVILPQPVAPFLGGLTEPYDNIFVDCTDNGSWYALSEQNYPGVTEGEPMANFYNDEMFKIGLPTMAWPPRKLQREKFTGVHPISVPEKSPGQTIDAPEWPAIDGPSGSEKDTKDVLHQPVSNSDNQFTLKSIVFTAVAVAAVCAYIYRERLGHTINSSPVAPTLPKAVKEEAVAPITPVPAEEEVPVDREPVVRVIEPSEEIIFPHEKGGAVSDAVPGAQNMDDISELAEITEEVTPEDGAEPKELKEGEDAKDAEAAQDPKDQQEANQPKKKKAGAHRGRRGGKKTKEKEQQQAEARAAKLGLPPPTVATPSPSPDPPAVGNTPVVLNLDEGEDASKVVGPVLINSLTINTDRLIGQGSCGTTVYEGSFEGRAVAVKRMLSQYYELASQEVSFLQQSDDHENVIRYFCQQKDNHFLYIAVELCQASLFEVMEAENGRTEGRQKQLMSLKLEILNDVTSALKQLAKGLQHLHNLRIIHRDIKPQNILVAFPKKGRPNEGPRLVISDFGLGKNLPENVSTLIDPTGNAGTSGWKAPELISKPRDSDSKHSQSNSHTGGGSENIAGFTSGVKRAADIFSLGCLFFWVLTSGNHPFEDELGWPQLRELNIKRDQKKMEVLERWSDAYEPMSLISSMLAHQPEHRPTAFQVLIHPFFWTPKQRLAFLGDCSDHFEREPRGTYEDGYAGDSPQLQLLESRAKEVIGERGNFLAKLDRHFVDTLGKQRKYSGDRMLDLLRALRNKRNHYEDMAEDVKRRVGPFPEGYLKYWCNRFPRLLIACYEVVQEAGLVETERFSWYFVPEA